MVSWRKKRRKKREPIKGSCLKCGKEFAAYRAWQKFCTAKCKTDFHNAQNVGQHKSLREENESLKAQLINANLRIEALQEDVEALKAKLAKITKPLLS